MRILLLSTAYNGMCQRVHLELEFSGHKVSIELSSDPAVMFQAFKTHAPELIICPFLKHRIPDSIWKKKPCLVLHPGIAGDRGPSSLDWAIVNRFKYWGATLLQANHEFDAGAIWTNKKFLLRKAAKASIYRHEVVTAAAEMINNVIKRYAIDEQIPHPTKNISKAKSAQWRPLMKQTERAINWQLDSGNTILNKINSADSFPGVKDKIGNQIVHLYGARFEAMNTYDTQIGEIIGQRDEAICRVVRDGIIWIRQIKLASTLCQSFYKLPATRVLSSLSKSNKKLPEKKSSVQNDITVNIESDIAYLHFDFYNGAFNTQQCELLTSRFKSVAAKKNIKMVVLMGGSDFFSNGINLNCIEHAKNPALESWLNINAMNDLVETIIKCDSVLTVASIKNNAGAGGAILPLACDYVVARQGVVLNPHYQLMGLTGSEFWSYLLPKRVGAIKAEQLMSECLPILAKEAHAINMLDKVLNEDSKCYQSELMDYCLALTGESHYSELLENKKFIRKQDQNNKPLASYRAQELKLMSKIFYDKKSRYHKLRHDFVHKLACDVTPQRLIYKDQPLNRAKNA